MFVLVEIKQRKEEEKEEHPFNTFATCKTKLLKYTRKLCYGFASICFRFSFFSVSLHLSLFLSFDSNHMKSKLNTNEQRIVVGEVNRLN